MSGVSTAPGSTSPRGQRRDSTPSSELDLRNVSAGLVAAAVVVAALYYGRDLLIPIATAFLITFALNPAVTWLVRRGLPRLLATSLVMAIVLCTLTGLGIILGAQVRSIAVELPAYQSTILKKLSDLRESLKAPGLLDGVLKTVERVQKEVEAKDDKPADGPPPERVEVVPTPETPFEQASTWLLRSLEPLATAGIIFIFVFLALLDISDLRDRFLRLLGGNFHRSTDAIEEAGARISKYLLMQLLVNVSYGVPLALGLWVIGVPGALLWGAVAAAMRFVPYIGPLLAAVFPIALAFAVDSGWSMLLWTVALIVVLELVSNNIVEPLLYGTSTGLSAISLIAAAMFWTALWGPVGLILSTPLTVCLLVLGRNLPQLQFLDTMLGSAPALDVPTRIYQRLIADDADEAIEIANSEIEKSSLVSFYDAAGIEVLRLASQEHLRNASAEHRLRLANGLDRLLDDLRDQYPSSLSPEARPAVLCIGGKWEIDAVAGEMLAHALAIEGIAADFHPPASMNADYLAKLDLKGADVVCLSYFTSRPNTPARHACRRLRRRWPDLRIVLALWNAPPELLTDESVEALRADAVVTSVQEAVLRIHRIVNPEEAKAAQEAALPHNDAERVDALEATGVLEGEKREALDALAKRVADIFNTRLAVISTIDKDREYFVGQSGRFPNAVTDDAGTLLPMDREHAICNYVVGDDESLVVPDIQRDPRFADNEAIKQWDVRFYAGAPLRVSDGLIVGALCILDSEPRTLEDHEIALLETMAADVAAVITPSEADEVRVTPPSAASSATVGQQVPK
ncbi:MULTISPECIES: AI-2E family transporter [unclassified Chelatococcus]|uniref:AI-2E family transporter n=1 Tax=unclassified Chelatococcus TaxID=2638111 RepID=UPI001BCAE66C|nr:MULTISPECIES: AI-2E family transporter [unclassified Chelatococcus]MBS7700307.1 AI-2E family transporter [Chelatococcus sp. YT9]MBX3556103.1 AI-2E family transporter [Chelatococcus sp.]